MGGPAKVDLGSNLNEFPGRSFNALVSQWYRTQAALGRDSGSSGGSGQILTVKAKNVTGATLKHGHCVAIEGLAFTFANKPKQVYGRSVVKANKPTSSLKHSILGVSLSTCANNKPGTFIVAGPAWLRCNYTSTAHNFVALKPNQSTFTELADSGTSGTPILDRETGTGDKWVLCLLGGGAGGDSIVYGRSTSAIPASTDDGDECVAGTGTVQPYKNSATAGRKEPDGDEVTVTNFLRASCESGADVWFEEKSLELREFTCPEEEP